MYRMMKSDLWGNQVPVMDLSSHKDADEFWRKHRDMTMRMIGTLRSKQSTLLQ